MLSIAETFYGESLIEQCKILLNKYGLRAVWHDSVNSSWTEQDIRDFLDNTNAPIPSSSWYTEEMQSMGVLTKTVIERHMYPQLGIVFSQARAELTWNNLLNDRLVRLKMLPTLSIFMANSRRLGLTYEFPWRGHRFCYKRKRWIVDSSVKVTPVLSPMSVSDMENDANLSTETISDELALSQEYNELHSGTRGREFEVSDVSSASSESESESEEDDRSTVLNVTRDPVDMKDIISWLGLDIYTEEELTELKRKTVQKIDEIKETRALPECPICPGEIHGPVTVMPCEHTYCSLHATQIALKGKCVFRWCRKWDSAHVTHILHLPNGGNKRDVRNKIAELKSTIANERRFIARSREVELEEMDT